FKGSVKPLLPGDDRFKILLTTRDRRLLPQENCLFLDVLTGERALALLGQFVGEERLGRERDLAVALVERLGRLPLAIELVGAYLQEDEDSSLARLLGRLEEKGLRAAALREVPEVVQAEGGVAAAFELSWERLLEGARRLAVLLGCFGLAPVPWGLVGECLAQEDEEELEQWRKELVRLCLLERRGEGLYGLHPLIWQFFGEKWGEHQDGETLRQAFLNTLVAVAKTVPYNATLSDQNRTRAAVPHLEHATEFTDQITTENYDYIWPFNALARLAESQSLWQQAEQHYIDIFKTTEIRKGADHPDTAAGLNNLAGLYLSQGLYEKAEPLYERSLQIHEEQLGADHPETARGLNSLALLHKSQGRYEKAEFLYEQSLRIRKEQLGADHPETAQSLNNLALLYLSQERYEKAEPLFEQSLQIREKQLGTYHPDTAQGLNNLAGLYLSQERYEKAEPLFRQSLQILEEQMGVDHPNTARSIWCLASLHRAQQKFNLSESEYLRCIDIFSHSLGNEHPYFKKALSQFQTFLQTVVEKNQTAQLSDHPLTQSILQQLQNQDPD
ncbi:MAG: tetratricopeptide repeat protein, partial [Cyanobacteria bacterium P01_F01_bin.153]